MKIIHTADWHIGQNLYGFERGEEHLFFLDWLKQQVVDHQADALLIAGDVFDSPNPSAESQRMYYSFLSGLARDCPDLQVVVTAGNHDSAGRLEAPRDLLRDLRVEVKGVVRRTPDGNVDAEHLIVPLKQNGLVKAWCLAVPYLRQGDYPEKSEYGEGVAAMYAELKAHCRKMYPADLPIVAMGHLHVSGAELSDNDRSERVVVGGLEYVDGNSFADGFAYVALGHLHKPQRVAGKDSVRYAGSPLPMSFSEKFYKQGVDLVELDDAGLKLITRLPFTPLASMMSLPAHPKPLTDVLALLRELPDGLPDACSPYLEIKVLETEPEPSKRHRIEEALQGKAVRLARIVASSPKSDRPEPVAWAEDWQNMKPLEMAQDVFRNRYGAEMPENLQKLLLDVIRSVENN